MCSQKPFVELRLAALNCLAETDALLKSKAVSELALAWQGGEMQLDATRPSECILATELRAIPGRPEKPELVPPLLVKRRAMNTIAGRAALVHALTHIEFNAINLALDAIWRFSDMPKSYYACLLYTSPSPRD